MADARTAVPILTAQTHWIRPNELSRQPKCWVYLDTEARIERDERGEVQRWRLGVTAHDHRRGAYDDWRDPEWAVHAEPADLWGWVDARARVGERLVVVAHNLAYDLRIADAFTHLPRLGWKLDRVRLDAEQAHARWRNGRRTIEMIDSISWVPVALEVIGAELGIVKPPLPADDADDAVWVERCVSDVNILRTFWRRILAWLHDDDIGNWQTTGAGQAWSAWRHRFMDHRVLVSDDIDLRTRERRATWCGRSEAWRHGRQKAGPYTEWDLTTCYLAIMRECAVPVRPLAPCPEMDDASLEHFAGVASVLATVEVTTDVPVVPAEGDHGILWPVGTFTTTLWDPELALLREVGAKVRVIDAMVYRRRPALEQFAHWLTPMCDPAFADIDPLLHRIAKHWSRAIVGRFGVRYTTWEPYGDAPFDQVGLQNVSDLREGGKWRMLSLGGEVRRESAVLEGENAAPMVMGWIMSETRARLWRAMHAAGLQNVVHVDTDGLLVTPAGSDALELAAVPGLRIKSVWEKCEVFGPRQLVLGGQLRAPGVPRRARRVGVNTWSGERWQGLGVALRAGTPDRVKVSRATIRLLRTDHRRQHLTHGRTAPFELGAIE